MKIFNDILNCFKNFFKSYWKLRDIEHSITQKLMMDYIKYQEKPDIQKLHRLMIVVSFCQQTGINGRTTKIQEEISKEWMNAINKKD